MTYKQVKNTIFFWYIEITYVANDEMHKKVNHIVYSTRIIDIYFFRRLILRGRIGLLWVQAGILRNTVFISVKISSSQT